MQYVFNEVPKYLQMIFKIEFTKLSQIIVIFKVLSSLIKTNLMWEKILNSNKSYQIVKLIRGPNTIIDRYLYSLILKKDLGRDFIIALVIDKMAS